MPGAGWHQAGAHRRRGSSKHTTLMDAIGGGGGEVAGAGAEAEAGVEAEGGSAR